MKMLHFQFSILNYLRMKKYCLFIFIATLSSFFGCNRNEDGNADYPSLPAPDYKMNLYWFGTLEEEKSKTADIFYVYPTLGTEPKDRDGNLLTNTNIDQQSERDAAFITQYFNKMVYAGEDFNFYAPLYRQITMNLYLQGKQSVEEHIAMAVEDIKNAFDYYMENHNAGRPFILLGHSQGSQVLLEVLKTMKTEYFSRMIAAYLIGYQITEKELQNYPQRLLPARDSSDLHSIILFNSLVDINAKSPFMNQSAVGINPVNWTTDGTPASKEQHKGMALYHAEDTTFTILPHCTSTYLDEHYLICPDIDPQTCYTESLSSLFPLGNLHFLDSYLYAADLKANMLYRKKIFK